MKAKQLAFFSILSVSMFFSCTKEKATDPADDSMTQELTAARLQSDILYDDVSLEVMQVNVENGLGTPTTETLPCATITVSPQDLTTWPKTVTIDYGTSGCTGSYGFVRKGKITYTLNKKLNEAGAVITVTFDNYSVNNYKLEGVFTLTNNGPNNGNLNLTTRLVNGKITYPDGRWYSRTSTINWVQTAGASTPLSILDDEVNITGEATIRSSANNELISSTKTALLRKFSCANIVSGQLNLNYNGITGVLDFGSGSCDKNAVLNIGTKNYDVTLP